MSGPLWIGADKGNFQAGRPAGFEPIAVVIHIMDGTLAGTDAWFNDPNAKVSAHYGIGRDGQAHQYVKETDTAYHAGVVDRPSWPLIKPNANPNFYTIGVEHEGWGTVTDPWPAAQLAASVALVRGILGRWAIPIDADHIVPHHAIRFAKTCPGAAFDLKGYLAALAAAPKPAPPVVTKASGKVMATSAVNVRTAPAQASATTRLLAKGDDWKVTGACLNGESVGGNPLWYQGHKGEFIWAGATDHPTAHWLGG